MQIFGYFFKNRLKIKFVMTIATCIFVLLDQCELHLIISKPFSTLISNQKEGDEEESALLKNDTNSDSNFCIDAHNVKHGLFGTWKDELGCDCTCNPAEHMAVIICDEDCSHSLSISDTFVNIPKLNDVDQVFTENTDSINESSKIVKHANSKELKACLDTTTGLSYRAGDIWMNPTDPCGKCHCIDGLSDCSNTFLHCPTTCSAGQTAVSTGACCRYKCVGKVFLIDNMEPERFFPCHDSNSNLTYNHGEVLYKQEDCVDQNCQCNNGEWYCLDFCTPKDSLPCPTNERVYWDKFCCPRCKGINSCQTTVLASNWLQKPPGKLISQSFVSILDKHKMERKKNEIQLPEGNVQTIDDSLSEQSKTKIITIQPGDHVVTEYGKCSCVDGNLRCSRSGSGIWHQFDCFYSNGQHGKYYGKGSTWRSHDDSCMDCKCLSNNVYTCFRAPCTSLFVCPTGKVPVIANGDCCPSTCEPITKKLNNSQTFQIVEDKMTINDVPKEHEDNLKVTKAPVIVPNLVFKNVCKPLGLTSTVPYSNVLLPVESIMIIKRVCISLKCICSSNGTWVCMDYCIPCAQSALKGIETPTDNFQLNFHGCCQSCKPASFSDSSNEHRILVQSKSEEKLINTLENYTKLVIFCLVVLILLPALMLAVCCIRNKHNKSRNVMVKRVCDKSKLFHYCKQQSVQYIALSPSTFASTSSVPLSLEVKPDTLQNHTKIESKTVDAENKFKSANTQQNSQKISTILAGGYDQSVIRSTTSLIQLPNVNGSNQFMECTAESNKVICEKHPQEDKCKLIRRNSTQSNRHKKLLCLDNSLNDDSSRHFFVRLPPSRQAIIQPRLNGSTPTTPTTIYSPISETPINQLMSPAETYPPPKPPFPKETSSNKNTASIFTNGHL